MSPLNPSLEVRDSRREMLKAWEACGSRVCELLSRNCALPLSIPPAHLQHQQENGGLKSYGQKPAFCQLPGELKRSSQAPERNAAQLTVISFVWLWANPHPDARPKETEITNLYYFNCSVCGCYAHRKLIQCPS